MCRVELEWGCVSHLSQHDQILLYTFWLDLSRLVQGGGEGERISRVFKLGIQSFDGTAHTSSYYDRDVLFARFHVAPRIFLPSHGFSPRRWEDPISRLLWTRTFSLALRVYVISLSFADRFFLVSLWMSHLAVATLCFSNMTKPEPLPASMLNLHPQNLTSFL